MRKVLLLWSLYFVGCGEFVSKFYDVDPLDISELRGFEADYGSGLTAGFDYDYGAGSTGGFGADYRTESSSEVCAMPTHNGQMSLSLEGKCLDSDDVDGCIDGVSYLGDADCGDGMICCVSDLQIDVVQDLTFRPNGDPSLCGQYEGFCVDITENNCAVESYVLEYDLCPGSDQILCCLEAT